MNDEFLLTTGEPRMPKFRCQYEETALFALTTRLVAFGVIIPGLAWLASNYVATSPLLTGFAFRDLSALGLLALAGSGVAKLYGQSFRSA